MTVGEFNAVNFMDYEINCEANYRGDGTRERSQSPVNRATGQVGTSSESVQPWNVSEEAKFPEDPTATDSFRRQTSKSVFGVWPTL